MQDPVPQVGRFGRAERERRPVGKAFWRVRQPGVPAQRIGFAFRFPVEIRPGTAASLPDGTRTAEPDDGMFYLDPGEERMNYGKNRRVLERFAACCETC